MKLFTLALDYDGIITRDDRLDPLAAELGTIESRHRGRAGPDGIPALINAIRARYDLREDALAGAG